MAAKKSQHVDIAAPQSSSLTSSRSASKATRKPVVRRFVGPWESVPDQEHRRRAASFGAAYLRNTSRRKVGLEESFDFYSRHTDLVIEAVRAYHHLRKRGRGRDYVSRASCWDGAFVISVLDGMGTVEDLSEFAGRWALMDWTLESVGVVANDLDTTVSAFKAAWLARTAGGGA